MVVVVRGGVMANVSLSCHLKVDSVEDEDVYKDVVRIAKTDRGSLRAGRIHRFVANGRTSYFIIRGAGNRRGQGKISMDEASRTKLGLTRGLQYSFEITEAGFWGELRWAFYATDPAYRVAARLGVLSFGLGLLALLPLAAPVLTLLKHGVVSVVPLFALCADSVISLLRNIVWHLTP